MGGTRWLDDEAFRIDLAADGVYRIVRSGNGFADVRACRDAHLRVVDALADVRGGGRALFDVRRAPPRNDPEFEAVVTELNAQLFRPFARVAFLVGSAAGKLHVRRLTRNVAADVEVFLDESAALDWLRERRSLVP